jgi:protein tyrosine phosphatase type 4A
MHNSSNPKDLSKYNAGVVVRVCDPSYDSQKLEQHGIRVIVSSAAAAVLVVCAHWLCWENKPKFILSLFNKKNKDAAFPDGQTPPPEIRDQWFRLLKEQFRQNPSTCIAIHCVAGLGRAPVMVALALMELGMSYEEAVELIRSKRRGALNTRQLEFLEKYRPKNRLKSRNGPCSIM